MGRSIPTFYTKILDSITDGVLTIDNDFKVTYLNKAAEAILGTSRADATGKLCTKILRPTITNSRFAICETLEIKKPFVNILSYIIDLQNNQIPISINTNLLRNSKNQIIGAIETFRDLSVTSKLRRALCLSEHSFHGIITKNTKMLKLLSSLKPIAESDSTILLLGSSGTGKELFAKAIHRLSPQQHGPFIAVNCGGLPDTLLESELFGFEAGAFTDAKKNKPGRFELAQNGTIFLDEIGNISQKAQIGLLRVLQDRCYDPLGSTRTKKTNCRIICATNCDMEKLVEEGAFREDLYYRINVIKLCLPDLNDKRDDIPLLVDHFIDYFNDNKGKSIIGIEQDALYALTTHDWKGNIRELENSLEHAFALCQGELIRLEHLPDNIASSNYSNDIQPPSTLKEQEAIFILYALRRNNWKKMSTARELGIDKSTLRRKMKKYGIG